MSISLIDTIILKVLRKILLVYWLHLGWASGSMKRKWDNRWQGLGVDKKPSVSCTTLFCIKRNEIYLETHELQSYRKCIRICQLATHDMSIVLYIHPISTHYLRRERIWEMIIRWWWNGMSKVISLIYIRILVILEIIE